MLRAANSQSGSPPVRPRDARDGADAGLARLARTAADPRDGEWASTLDDVRAALSAGVVVVWRERDDVFTRVAGRGLPDAAELTAADGVSLASRLWHDEPAAVVLPLAGVPADGWALPLVRGGVRVGLVLVAGLKTSTSPGLLATVSALLSVVVVERERLQAESRERDERADMHRLAALGVMHATIAHELRGPVGALALLAPDLVAATEGASPELSSLARDVGACAARIAGLTSQVLSMARAGSEAEGVDLAELAEETARVARVHARAVGVELTCDVRVAYAHGRRDRLGQVLLNLMLNAIDACAGAARLGHRVTVRTWSDGQGGHASVADTGPGVDESVADAIFDRFFSTKRRGSGTGLGLAVAREIVEDHGGTIAVRRNEHGGATFVVSLPLRERASHPRIRCLPQTAQRVLVVDDDPVIGRAYQRALRGHELTIVSTLEAAKRALEGSTFHVVLSDLALDAPGDGVELHRFVSRLSAPPRFVFVTGGDALPADARYLATCGAPCLLKPVSIDALRAAVGDELTVEASTG
jgi:signal transduction histidine kinase/ActR/RegA family two-component response regulator